MMTTETEIRLAVTDADAPAVVGRTIVGYAIKWGESSSDLGGFVETFRRGAFVQSLRTGDQLALWNHDVSHPLGRVSAGTLKLFEDSIGLGYSIDIPNTTTGRDAMESVRRGDVKGASVRFRKPQDTWTDRQTREIIEAELVEISLTAMPAYPTSTASVRGEHDGAASGARSTVEPEPWRAEARTRRLRLLQMELGQR
jgi:HK97 family phage prohead protease